MRVASNTEIDRLSADAGDGGAATDAG